MRLTHREKMLFAGFLLFAVGWAIFTLAIKPTFERVETLSRVIPQKNEALRQLRLKSTQYLALESELKDFQTRVILDEAEFKPVSFLESTIKQSSLAKNVNAMKQDEVMLDSNYSETIVQIDFKGLTLEQMVNFLHKISSSQHFLQIKSLYTRQNAINSGLLDTMIQVSTIKPNR